MTPGSVRRLRSVGLAVTLAVLTFSECGGSNETTAANGGPGQSSQPGAKTGTVIFVNEREITSQQADDLRRTYGAAPPAGHYWYDTRSGMYGVSFAVTSAFTICPAGNW